MNKTRAIACLLFFGILFVLFLFTRLGHYALWGDEALTALAAEGVLRTGDTTAVIDHNLVAYRGGTLLLDLHDRSTPPLPAYVTAVSMGILGRSAWAARLPFALLGLATLVLIFWWARKDGAPFILRLLIAIAFAGHVSFFLYARNCRYYEPAIFFSVAIAYIYCHWDGRVRDLVMMAVLSTLLFASNQMNYLALNVCLAADYFIWRRKLRPLAVRDWLILLLPQILCCGVLAGIWNTLGTELGRDIAYNSFVDRLKLFCWNWRDLDRCEFFVGALMLAVPIVGFVSRQVSLLRGSLAMLLYVAIISAVSPQPVDDTFSADVRYVVPLIPLFVVLQAMTLLILVRSRPWLAVPLAIIVFGSNVFSIGVLFRGNFHSTPVRYVMELIHPPGDPYTVTAQWIDEHVKEKESIWVTPDSAIYGLMFRAPGPTYAWQLENPADPRFKNLPPIHFKYGLMPDYIVAFGPDYQEITRGPASRDYQRVATLDFYHREAHRPELFLRSFKPITRFDRQNDAIYIFKRVDGQIPGAVK